MLEIKLNEVLRMLGVKKESNPESIINEITRIHRELNEICVPKNVWKVFPLEMKTDGEYGDFSFGGLSLKSHSLLRNLEGCSKIAMLAVTLGMESEYYLKRQRASGTINALISQSVSADMVEQYCNKINDEITEFAMSEGYKTHIRFSPGYGDFPLEYQDAFLDAIDAYRQTGIRITESHMMIPSKSITAIIGFERIQQV
ncbi:MAG: vitamin B12 dependent-methionine synthase activation domain-containing protein [Lachnospiraceae bacterium]|jgi:hypothetical protein